jgi:hypothetical protein
VGATADGGGKERRTERPATPRRDRDEMRVHDVAVGGEEPRMTRLQREQLMPRGAQHREIVGRHDHVAKRSIDEVAVRHLQRDPVTRLDLVDLRERSQEGRSVSGDVDEAALPGHEGAEVSARPALQGRLIRPVHEHHVQAQAGNHDPPDRLPYSGPVAEASRGQRDRTRLGAERFRALELRAEIGRELLLQLRGEFVLLPSRVQARDRVLPAPDDYYPDQSKGAEDGKDDSGNSSKSAHSS